VVSYFLNGDSISLCDWTTFRVGKPQEGYFPDPEGKSETNCFFKGNLILFVGHLVLGLASGLEARSAENHHAVASEHSSFDELQKPEAWHGSSSRTTPYFPHDTCEIPSQSQKRG